MRLLFFYALLAFSAWGITPADLAERALGQERYSRAYKLLINESLSDQSALLLLESATMSGADRDKALKQLEGSKDAGVINQRDFWLALASSKKGELAEAQNLFKALLPESEEPYTSAIRHNLANLYLASGDLTAAQELFSSPPSTLGGQLLYAEVLLQAKEYKNSEDLLNEMASYDGLDKALLLAKAIYGQGRVEDAINELKKKELLPLSLVGREALSFLTLLELEEGVNKGGYPRMLSVLEQLGSEDHNHIDITLLVAQNENVDTTQLLADLSRLRDSSWPERQKPELLFTLAQLQPNLEAKIETLSAIYQEYPDSQLSVKSCYLAAQLALQVEPVTQRKATLERIAKESPTDPVKAKIYSWLAEGNTAEDKLKYYTEALKYAGVEQLGALQLNHNLASLTLPIKERNYLDLTAAQEVDFLYEQALHLESADPSESQMLFREFLVEAAESDDRRALAHLTLAELALEKVDPKLAHTISEDIEQAQKGGDSDRLRLAELDLALLIKDLAGLREFVNTSPVEKSFLFRSGKRLYDAGQPNFSSQQFKKLKGLEMTKGEEALGGFYTALSYLQIGTDEHKQEALKRLKLLSEGKGALEDEARLVLANYHLEIAEAQEALAYAQELPESVPSALIKARAYVLLSGKGHMDKAYALYRQLLLDPNLPILQRYQVANQYASVLQQDQRTEELVELNYQFVNFEVLPEPATKATWSVYNQLCDRAITFLEKTGEAEAAYKLALQASKSKTPAHAHFSKRADELTMKVILREE